jgi:hypothetical protein
MRAAPLMIVVTLMDLEVMDFSSLVPANQNVCSFQIAQNGPKTDRPRGKNFLVGDLEKGLDPCL